MLLVENHPSLLYMKYYKNVLKNFRMGLGIQRNLYKGGVQMNKIKYSILLLLFLITTAGCASAKKITYVGAGSLIGAGAGYAIDRDGKDAAIGGLVGGTAGAIVADFQEKKESKKYKLGFD